MQHWIAIAGAVFGIIGTLALSVDLLGSKTDEDSIREFENTQDMIENVTRKLIVKLNDGLISLGAVTSGCFKMLQMEAELDESNSSASAETDIGLEALKELFPGGALVDRRKAMVNQFVEIQSKLISRNDTKKALELVSETRKQIEKRYTEEVKRSRMFRRIAIFGVCLVGIGAIAQLLSIVVGNS